MSITLAIIAITCLISYPALSNRGMLEQLKHSPYMESTQKEYYRFITSGFVHGSFIHLFINMFVLYMFGSAVENFFIQEQMFGETMGRINFLLLYLLAIVVGDLPTYAKHKNNPHFGSVGASGAVSALLFTTILFEPWGKIYLYLLIEIPSIVFAILYVGYSTWASKNQNDMIDHDAHLYGAIFGFLFAIALKPDLFNYFLTRLMEDAPF
ncbi:MAG: rhomboid family intramembrane serine protease [Bacteroidota bacterium]